MFRNRQCPAIAPFPSNPVAFPRRREHQARVHCAWILEKSPSCASAPWRVQPFQMTGACLVLPPPTNTVPDRQQMVEEVFWLAGLSVPVKAEKRPEEALHILNCQFIKPPGGWAGPISSLLSCLLYALLMIINFKTAFCLHNINSIPGTFLFIKWDIKIPGHTSSRKTGYCLFFPWNFDKKPQKLHLCCPDSQYQVTFQMNLSHSICPSAYQERHKQHLPWFLRKNCQLETMVCN